MHIVLVNIRVKMEKIEDFIAASAENARNSRKEAGIVRFDLIQQKDDPANFVLLEVYRTPGDQALHRETAHYLAWRDAVDGMMDGPRKGLTYRSLNTPDEAWGYGIDI